MAIDTSIRIRLVDGFTAGLRRLRTGLGGAGSALQGLERSSQLAANLNQAAEGADRLGAMAQAALGVPAREFANFEEAMSRVAALSGEVATPAFNEMQAQAEALGAATSFSAAEAATAMGNYAVAGLNANQIMSVTPATLSLARAGAESLDRTSEILGNTLNTLGMNSSEAGRAADVMTATFAGSNTTLGSIGESFKAVGALAADSGTDIETLSAMIAALGNNGIQGSEAGTGLRTVLASLTSPAGAGAEALKKLGFRTRELAELQELVGTGRLPEALARIGASMGDLSNDERIGKLMELFGREGATSASILIRAAMDDGPRGIAAFTQSLRQADGTADQIAETMGDNLTGELTRLQSAASGAAIAAGRALAPDLRELAVDMQGLAGFIQGAVQQYPGLTGGMGRALVGIIGLTAGVRAMALVASAATSTAGILQGGLSLLRVGILGTAASTTPAVAGMGRMRVAMLAMQGPAGLMVAALGAMAAAALAVHEAERQAQAEQRENANARLREGVDRREREDQAARAELRRRMQDREAELEPLAGAEGAEGDAARAELEQISARRQILDREDQTAEARFDLQRQILDARLAADAADSPKARQDSRDAVERLEGQLDTLQGFVRGEVDGETAGIGTGSASGAESDSSNAGASSNSSSQGGAASTQPAEAAATAQAQQLLQQAQVSQAEVASNLGANSQQTTSNTQAIGRLTAAVERLERTIRAGGGGREPLGGTA